MSLLNRLIDRAQAMFPPNRVVVLCGGLLTAASGAVAAWLAVHFPGLKLGAPEVAGIMAAALLISIRLLDRWLDQWQKGEPLTVDGDLNQALEELDQATTAFFSANLEGLDQRGGSRRPPRRHP